MTRARRAGTSSPAARSTLAWLALASAALLPACKRYKPPKVEELTLSEEGGCGRIRGGALYCWSRATGGRPARLAGGDGLSRLVSDAARVCGLRSSTGEIACAPLAGGSVATVGHAEGARSIVIHDGRVHALLDDGSSRVLDLAGATPSASGAARRARSVAAYGGTRCEVDDASVQAMTCDGRSPRVKARIDPSLGVVRDIAVGASSACVRSDRGKVACLALDAPPGTAPREVEGIDGAVSIALGRAHGCARLARGAVACWGDNAQRQLADGTTVAREDAKVVFGLAAIDEIVAAGDGTCARLADGTVRCWGDNRSGALAVRLRAIVPVPTPIDWYQVELPSR